MKISHICFAVLAATFTVARVNATGEQVRKVEPQIGASISAQPSCAAPTVNPEVRTTLLKFETSELAPVSDTDRHMWLYSATLAGHPDSPPPGTAQIISDFILPNMVRRSVYVTCNLKSYYFLDRGGVIDQFLWFGPITSEIGRRN